MRQNKTSLTEKKQNPSQTEKKQKPLILMRQNKTSIPEKKTKKPHFHETKNTPSLCDDHC